MIYLAGYGSLIHQNETKRHLFSPTCRILVRIFGFERIFNQKVTSRKTDGNKAAVLNITQKRNAWINAVLLGGFDEQFHQELDIRESGYDRVSLSLQDIYSYNPINFHDDDKFFIYVGKSGAQDRDILPITDYLHLCLDGAKQFTNSFYEDFLDTTFVNQNIILRKYLKL